MKMIFSIILSVITGIVNAQSVGPAVINSSGLSASVNNIHFEFNLGESFTTTIGSVNFITQGLLQPVSFSQGPLPVTGLEFQARRTNNANVLLQWKTLQEINNKGFYVERKKENEPDFVAVHWVNSSAPNGNATLPLSYAFNDTNHYSGKTYYRLKQVDIDGAFVYSPVRIAEGTTATITVLKAWPIPSYGTVNVSAEGIDKAVLQLYDMTGKLIKQQNINSTSVQQITGLAAGTYILRLAGEKNIAQKIIVQ